MEGPAKEKRFKIVAGLFIAAIPVMIIAGWLSIGEGPKDGPNLTDAYTDGRGKLRVDISNRNKDRGFDMTGWTIDDGERSMPLPAGIYLAPYVARRSGSGATLTEGDLPFIPPAGAKLRPKTPAGEDYGGCVLRRQDDPDFYADL